MLRSFLIWSLPPAPDAPAAFFFSLLSPVSWITPHSPAILIYWTHSVKVLVFPCLPHLLDDSALFFTWSLPTHLRTTQASLPPSPPCLLGLLLLWDFTYCFIYSFIDPWVWGSNLNLSLYSHCLVLSKTLLKFLFEQRNKHKKLSDDKDRLNIPPRKSIFGDSCVFSCLLASAYFGASSTAMPAKYGIENLKSRWSLFRITWDYLKNWTYYPKLRVIGVTKVYLCFNYLPIEAMLQIVIRLDFI